ncbi:ATP-binding protein [Cupriavidus plantarum]|uniref:histidine kinase n=1 Tax=Cupriavidus plantarum TaxID=942865 RepID=A0A316F2W5_9BURK|nr:ATP-binding protein [Cupriavidus plantarum]PWK37849.1 signal transduction histidine kinase [Cupriavidus plantarum]
MRWLPRGISGQLVVYWVVGLLAAHVIAVLALSWWRADNAAIHPLSMRAIEKTTLATYRAAGRSADPATLLEDLSGPESTFRIAPNVAMRDGATQDGATHVAIGDQETAIADRLSRALHATQDAVQVRLLRLDPDQGARSHQNWLERAISGTYATALEIDLRLPDGRWLESRHLPTMLPAHWSRVLTFSLFVGVLPTALIALVFGRRIMVPLNALTEASRRVSRGEHVALPPADRMSGLREITKAFNDMQESLLRFVGGRTQMLAAIGHDLRTPLTSLRIRAELVDDDELRAAIVQTVDEMTLMVAETLSFARDDATKAPTEDVQIGELVRDVVDAHVIQGRSVSWVAGQHAAISYRCRPVHLKRALSNLIDNAARYGDVGVLLISDAVHRMLRIEVSDRGPGIDPDQMERVFEPFIRIDASRGKDTGGLGLGLGLAIARNCVRAHGGELRLENRQGGGLLAVIELPN